ncbi:hypothetical protein PYW08_010728 [Mythimna loreyi]|uniref:Uncharacterized protein n=1 Tax=Mythimna loreyi TaxID=667449 RepID=A0ACC2Q539_9NEOP|nr:hypothetical protein PYW08_010728 [Mythimna loreyi]
MMTPREKLSNLFSFNRLQLIKLVQERPALWDKTNDSYRRKYLKDAAWHEICRSLKKDYDDLSESERQNFYRRVSKIWRHIRDSWARSINARKKALKYGSPSVRPYKYNKELSFLKKIQGPTKNSIRDRADTEDEEEEDDDDDEDNEDEVLNEEKNDESGSESAQTWEHDYECTDEEWNADSKEGIITTINNDNTVNEIDSTVQRKDNDATENLIDSKMTMFLEQIKQKIHNASDVQEDRHYAFFRSVHPSLTSLDDDQILEFQSGVINLLRNIKHAGRSGNVTNQPCSSSSRGFNLQPDARIASQQTVVATRVTQNISSSSPGCSRTQLRQNLDPLKTE